MESPGDANVDTILAEVIEWIRNDRAAEGLEEIELTPDIALLEQQVFDSMKILEFVNWLESSYAISIGVEKLTPKLFSSPRTVANEVHLLQLESRRQTS
jgi:acyl carrier protein